MMKDRSDRVLMTKARDALRILSAKVSPESAQILLPLISDLDFRIEQMLEEERYYKMPKESRERIKLSALGNRNLWDDKLTVKFEKAKELHACGLLIRDACAQAGISRDQWNRRRRIEKRGVEE